MQKSGFIFSLDAFVAFTLVMVTVSLLIFTISIPRPFYPSLEQAHQLAYDGLSVLANGKENPSNPQSRSYLQVALSGNSEDVDDVMQKILGGNAHYNPIIPQGFGYRLEHRVLDGSGTETWIPIYDAGTDGCGFGSDRCGKSFTKLSASATTFLSVYPAGADPFQGTSPYCYLSCSGYNPNNDPNFKCNSTPCDIPLSNFDEGQNSIQMVRLVVYT